MSAYRKISPAIWEGDFAAAVAGDSDSVALAFYLMTTRHNLMGIGLFRCPATYVAEDLGRSVDSIERAAGVLSRCGFAEYDDHRKVWWVTKQAGIEWGSSFNPGANRVKGLRTFLADHLADLRKSRLVQAFCDHYRDRGWQQVLPLLPTDSDTIAATSSASSDGATTLSFRCRDGVETLSEQGLDAIVGPGKTAWAQSLCEELSVASAGRRPKRRNLARWLKSRADRDGDPVPQEEVEAVAEGLAFGLRGLAHYTRGRAKARPFDPDTQAGAARVAHAEDLIRQLGRDDARRAARNLVLSANHNGTAGAEYLDLEYVARRPQWFLELCPGDDRAFASRLRRALASGEADAPTLPTLAEVEASAVT